MNRETWASVKSRPSPGKGPILPASGGGPPCPLSTSPLSPCPWSHQWQQQARHSGEAHVRPAVTSHSPIRAQAVAAAGAVAATESGDEMISRSQVEPGPWAGDLRVCDWDGDHGPIPEAPNPEGQNQSLSTQNSEKIKARGGKRRWRERRRRHRTYRTLLARAARLLPGRHRCRCVHPSSARTQHHLAKFKGAGRKGEGAQRRERSGGDWGRVQGGGENSKCYNFLPCPPPGLGEGSALRAPMSSLSFSPPRSPPLCSCRPLKSPPWRLRPGWSFRLPWPGSPRMEAEREEEERKVRSRAGRCATEQHPGP